MSYSGPFKNNKFECIEMIKEHIRENDIRTICSIGCGTCLIEDELLASGDEIEIVGYDPNPYSSNCVDINGNKKCYSGNVKLQQREFLFSDLTNNIPDCVFIFWPNSNQSLNYDLIALEYLLPQSFCVTFGPFGNSGSNELLDVLRDENDLLEIKKYVEIKNCRYYLRYCLNEMISNCCESICSINRLVIYQKCDDIKKVDKDPVIKNIQKKKNCCIM